jgi:hypothetical protein
MTCHKTGTGWLLYDDVDDVLTVEAASMSEELFLPIIMVFRPILKLPGETTVR